MWPWPDQSRVDESVPRWRRVDPTTVQPSGAADHAGVWTLDLPSPLPLHPKRLAEHLEQLGTGRLRGRGHF